MNRRTVVWLAIIGVAVVIGLLFLSFLRGKKQPAQVTPQQASQQATAAVNGQQASRSTDPNFQALALAALQNQPQTVTSNAQTNNYVGPSYIRPSPLPYPVPKPIEIKPGPQPGPIPVPVGGQPPTGQHIVTGPWYDQVLNIFRPAGGSNPGGYYTVPAGGMTGNQIATRFGLANGWSDIGYNPYNAGIASTGGTSVLPAGTKVFINTQDIRATA